MREGSRLRIEPSWSKITLNVHTLNDIRKRGGLLIDDDEVSGQVDGVVYHQVEVVSSIDEIYEIVLEVGNEVGSEEDGVEAGAKRAVVVLEA